MEETKQLLFIFVLGGAFLWGIGNVLQKYYLKDHDVDRDVMVVGTMCGASVFSFAAEFMWNGVPHVTAKFWLPFAVTAGLNVVMARWHVAALKWEDASIVTPLAATMPMFVIVMSWVLLREWPTFYGRIGIFLVACGSYILALRGSNVALPPLLIRMVSVRFHKHLIFYGAPWLRLLSSRGARLALFCAYLGAIAVNFDKLATLNSSPMLFTGSVFGVVALSTYGWSKSCGQWDSLEKKCFGKLLLLGLFIGLYTIILNAGYFFGIVPYVGTLKRTQILWTVLFAGLFLGEKHALIRFVGAMIIFTGAVLIAF